MYKRMKTWGYDMGGDIKTWGYDTSEATYLRILLNADGDFVFTGGHERCLKLAAEGNEVARQVLVEKMRRAMGVYPREYIKK